MAYSELIKSFARIRAYMRSFYVYGFAHRGEVGDKSRRSYDNERRRVESWLGDYLSFGQDEDGRRFFLSVDSRAVPSNPLYRAFRARSFTDRDILLHFHLLDLLSEEGGLPIFAIMEELAERLNTFEDGELPDESTVRKKLKEYEKLGLVVTAKRGRECLYRRRAPFPALERWGEAVRFFSEAAPLGVVGSYVGDLLPEGGDFFRFKHHYLLSALDSEVLCALAQAIGEGRSVTVATRGEQSLLLPLKFYFSTQTGRQYLLSWSPGPRRFVFRRLDLILSVRAGEVTALPSELPERLETLERHLWGVSLGDQETLDHLSMTVLVRPGEGFVLERLQREKRCGTVEQVDETHWRYSVECYDALELMPWVRSFIGRITDFETDHAVAQRRFFDDVEALSALYGEEPSGKPCSDAFRQSSAARRKADKTTANAAGAPGKKRTSSSREGGRPLLFHEIYGSYYRAVSAVLGEAVRGTLTRGRLQELVRTHAFGESLLSIPDGLTGERWRLLHRDLSTPMERAPERPVSLLERRWLRSLLLDPRIRLFDVDGTGLEDVEPLFRPEWFVYFDRSGAGDPYRDEGYIARFRTILTALREQQDLHLRFRTGKGVTELTLTPQRLEYSEKDDCFRLLAAGRRWDWVVRLSRLEECVPVVPGRHRSLRPRKTRAVTFELEDRRNALERVLLHFSHLEKETKRLDEKRYRVTLRYDSADETELLIRLLSFGPMIRVTEGESLIRRMTERIQVQRRTASGSNRPAGLSR